MSAQVTAEKPARLAGWETVALSDVADVINGGTPKSNVPAFWGGDVQWLTPKDMGKMDGREMSLTPRTITRDGLAKSSAREVPPRSVILSTRAPIGHLAINTHPMAFNQGCRGIVPSRCLDHIFLFYFLETNRQKLNDLGSGTTFKELSATNLKAIKLSLPPLDEQKRIVAVLDQAFAALDRARALAEANLADAIILFETSLDDVMTTHSTVGEKTKLGSVCTFENGDRGVNYPGRKAFVPEGIPFINAGHLDRGSIDWEAMNFIPEAHFHRISKGKVKKGDLLFCLRGSLGKFGHVDREGLGAIASSLVIVRAGNALLTDYLQMYFKSKGCRQMIDRYAGGAAQPNLSAGDLKKFEIIVPSLDRQTVAVEDHDRLLDATLKLGDAYTMQLEYLADLRQSLLQKAFSGQLT